jgi:CspA family cold shock protein
VQGVIKSYDPSSREGTLVRDTDRAQFELADDALEGSIFRMLRQGQRVIFELDGRERATRLRLGSERDMDSPTEPPGPRA